MEVKFPELIEPSAMRPAETAAVQVIATTLFRADASPLHEASEAAHVLVCALRSNNLLLVSTDAHVKLLQELNGTRDENESLRSLVDALTKERDAAQTSLEEAQEDLRMEKFGACDER